MMTTWWLKSVLRTSLPFKDLNKWKKFFSDAGIPSSEASTYAFKFSSNRIQTHMLTDLNKDYLKEMGITLMGDVIAILKHAKQVYEEMQKNEKTGLEDDKDNPKERELPIRRLQSVVGHATRKDVKVQSKVVNPNLAQKRKAEQIITTVKKPTIERTRTSPFNSENIEECEDMGYVFVDTKKSIPIATKVITTAPKVSGPPLPPSSPPTPPPPPPSQQPLPVPLVKVKKEAGVDDDDSSDEDDDNVEVIIENPVMTPYAPYKKYQSYDPFYSNYNKAVEYPPKVIAPVEMKRTVFKRLGDEVSQHFVTSTTTFEDEEQINSLLAKKVKEETAAVKLLLQDKNFSVFHRLGHKCDVTSTSVEQSESEKQLQSVLEIKEVTNKNKKVKSTATKIVRKIKLTPEELKEKPAKKIRVKSTYTEGILGNPNNEFKPRLKDRLGMKTKSSKKSGKSRRRSKNRSSDYEYDGSDFDDLPSEKKRVSFGSVSEKLIPTREEAIKNGELDKHRVSVFDRLGYNRRAASFP